MTHASDGGGIRVYWSLLVLEKLMEHIAKVEQNTYHELGPTPVLHSFSPEPYPEDCSQEQFSREEQKAWNEAVGEDNKMRARHPTRRYLPCHYFDTICGSSTGSSVSIPHFNISVTDSFQSHCDNAGKISNDSS